MRAPEFLNLLKVLRREVPDRPTLFDFFLNDRLYRQLAGPKICAMDDDLAQYRIYIEASRKAGYDYVTLGGIGGFRFDRLESERKNTTTLNHAGIITDRASFDRYEWPEIEKCDLSLLQKIEKILPNGMKVIVFGADGVLENVIGLVGYDELCYMTEEDPELVEDLFEQVGSRFVKYYRACLKFDTVGAIISNDDWGFKTQTLFSPSMLRRYVFPWHKRIVEEAHAAGKPAILHSCGELTAVMDDIIDDMRFDGKHSFEDIILPIEAAYEKWGSRIAMLGGMDMDFLCRATPERIRERAKAMLERAATRGGYALGTGNSVPDYIPDESFFAMTSAALDS